MRNFNVNLQKLLLSGIILFAITANVNVLKAQSEDDPFSMNVSLNSDAFFGFAPTAFGAYSLNENIDFTFYGIFWSGGAGASWGNWTEFGVGANFKVNDALSINPAIGVLGGSLLSGLNGADPKFPDGVVPNVTIGLNDDLFEGEIYAGYYIGTGEGKDFDGPDPSTTYNYVHYWTSFGVKASDFFSGGLLWEHLYYAGGSNDDNTAEYYQSFGPYVQFSDPEGGASLRFSVGSNLVDEENREVGRYTADAYYKLSVGYSF